MAERRVKEIGIRKILGSTVTGIILKLSKEYLTLLLYANIIAWIISFLVMKKFLEVFAYRINLGAGFFVVAAFAVSFLALLTVGYQAVKSASKNPAETLRYE
jgi:putative ABC transport system permease protein